MAWQDAVLTRQGKELNAKALAGQLRLTFTEVWVGDGNLTDQVGARDLANKRLKADIVGIKDVPLEGVCKVELRISNERLTGASLKMREIGFYMQNEQGQSTLYATVINDEPQVLPVMGRNGPSHFRYTMAFGYSDAADITVQTTVQQGLNETAVRELFREHNQDITAHNLNKYAGGTAIPNVSNWNDLRQPGIYEGNAGVFGWANAPSQGNVYPYGTIHVHVTSGNVVTQSFYSYGQGKTCKVATRTYYNSWSPWHYIADYEASKNGITSARLVNNQLEFTKAGGTKELVNLLTSNKADSNTALAPTLAVVKSLIGDLNFDVSQLLQAKGVRFNFTNPNAWYLCLGEAFGGLIIQGGTGAIDRGTHTDVNLPIHANPFSVMATDSLNAVDTSVPHITLTWNKGFSANNNATIRILSNTSAGAFSWLALCKA